MSHIAKIELDINDLDALRAACVELGASLSTEKKSFIWYSGESFCDAVIQVPGASYEIGVVRCGQNFELCCDLYESGGLEKALGKGLGRLKQAYARERVRREARQKGYAVREQKTEKGIRLVLTQRR
ncbi:DUF1257 domain-containing protein [Desulfoferrobacter suflitae]|uniref:DUF1257 domain-containing protein n=1 Tax=Desulfoferrobacter suflitae TaxID=2865782 RepID=UPI00216439F7|nr:DUF1257 domain-containing protein [Desulfoferrobacter suflitae]MCK8600093.1 DUF1257 domain-containing protein [Desulfoferrobacter suflitae]